MKYIFCLFSLGFLVVFAQQDPIIDEQLTVNLVELDVKVQTLSGKYLHGLKQSEFSVYENGELQEITHFEEVDLMRLPNAELQEYQSKIMILLDFQNSSHSAMVKVFGELRDYFDTEYDGKSLIGMALNSGGISEVLSFTNNIDTILNAIDSSERLFKKALYKDNFYERMIGSDFGSYSNGSNSLSHHQDSYFRNQTEIFGQFLNFVGTYTGKKSIVMITGPWGQVNSTDGEGNENVDSVLSVRDIQTSCLFNKISINVISLPHPKNDIARQRTRNRSTGVYDRTVELAAMSSGSFKQPVNAHIQKSFAATVDQVGRFYRVRYYSNEKSNKYRRLKVKVKGLNKMVNTLSGYFPGEKNLSTVSMQSDVNLTKERSLQLQIKTDWLQWQRVNRKEVSSNYAIGYRVYGDNGAIVAEHVSAGVVTTKKGIFPVLKQNIQLILKENQDPIKVQTVVTDLTSGKRIVINTLNTDML